MKLGNNRWINADVQAHTKPPSIPLIRSETENLEECNIFKIKMRRDPASATSKTYKLKFPTFKNIKPEEFLQITKDFKIKIDGTGTTPTNGKINFLYTMLCAESLIQFDVLAS